MLEARGDKVSQEMLDELAQAPEVFIATVSSVDSPIVVSDAKMKVITREQFQRMLGDRLSISSDATEYLTLPVALLHNVTSKRIRRFTLGFLKNDRLRVALEYASAIEPGGYFQLRSEWQKLNAVLERDPENLTLKVVSVKFEDGSEWGAPTLPRVRGRLMSSDGTDFESSPGSEGSLLRKSSNSEAAVVTGSGVGVAIGRGEGAGTGVGEGAGTAKGEGTGTGRGVGVGGKSKGEEVGGELIDAPNPVYPPIARAARASGTVTVEITVDEAGKVISARAVAGHPLLQSAAVEAARRALFTPTLIDGQAVKVKGQLSYKFVLPEKNGSDEQQ